MSKQVGTATWINSSDVLEGSGSAGLLGSSLAGFSASYYTFGGQTVIAYRGTDFDTSSAAGVFEFLKDIATGWLASGGFIDPEHFDPLHAGGDGILDYQPYYAQKFYELVTGGSIFPTVGAPANPANVILTSHSLGGSLAGCIGTLTGSQTTIFNEIPYIGMALNSSINAFIGNNLDAGADALVLAVTQILHGQQPSADGFSSWPVNLHSQALMAEAFLASA